MNSPILIASEIYRGSTYGKSHPLAISRVSSTLDLIRAMGWVAPGQYRESAPASPEQLTRFHDADYVAALMQAEATQLVPPADKARFNIGINGNPIYPEMFRRPATSCGGTLIGAGILADAVEAGMPAVVHNLGGGTHHGRRAGASGFCYLNDPVLGILHLLDRGLDRVLYLDIDAHHGDGVEIAFADPELNRGRVMTVSIHEDGRWPYTGKVEDRGCGLARNLPVPPDFNDDELAFLVEEAVLPLIERWDPQAVIVQCGCDGLADDPMSKLGLSNRGIWAAVARVAEHSPRLLALGGGGYNPWAVARCWTGIWAVLNGLPIPDILPQGGEAVLRALTWARSQGRNPPEHWFTTLADTPRPGPVRNAVSDLVAPILS